MPRYADKYLDELFDSSEYLDLVMLQGILATPPLFNSALPEYGLPTHFFVVVEGLAWFAQSTRSGVSTTGYVRRSGEMRTEGLCGALSVRNASLARFARSRAA
jgi:hypothetical protein